MFLPSSPAAQPPVDHSSALAQALAEVGGLSFFGFVEPIDAARFASLVAAESAWMAASVDFRGGFAGVVRCAVPLDLARELVSAFSGDSEAADDDRSVGDLFGEFVNMVCGSWLSKRGAHGVFSLGGPQVTRMAAGWSPSPMAGATTVLAVFNDRPIALWMTAAE